MAGNGSLFSQTLQDITTAKLEALSKQRDGFEGYRSHVLSLIHDDADNLRAISETIKVAFGLTIADEKVVHGGTSHNTVEIDLINLDRILAQAKYDPSFSTKLLRQWQDKLLRHMENQSMKYMYAWLYGQLTMEWLSTKSSPSPSAKDQDADKEDFEHVSKGKKIETRAKWEQSVFTPANVDRNAIAKLLHGLFKEPEDESQALPDALEAVRRSVSEFETQITRPGQFDISTLRWTIKGLLSSDLLTEDKKSALRDFQTNDTILSEVADVLNMRLSALKDWSWGTEVLVEERRQLNGTYSIFMHEDLLQAIFLQQIGVRWSVFWKGALRGFQKRKDVWKRTGDTMTLLDKKRRKYFLMNRTSGGTNVATLKRKRYRQSYFVSQLLVSEYQETNDEEGDEEADFAEYEGMPMMAAPQAPAKKKMKMSVMAARKSAPPPPPAEEGCEEADEDMGYGLFDDDDDNDQPNTQRNPMALKQTVLHLLSADILIQTRLQGECSCFRSAIDNLFPSLPHDTIRTVLEYFGVSTKWLQFFTKFLEAPLRFADDDSSQPRARRNGTPGSHVLSEVFGELILFCLDLSINQEAAGEYLWRVQDDLWLWSDKYETTAAAWSTVQKFAGTMGLKLSEARTGAVRIAKNEQGVKSVPVDSRLPKGQIRWGMLALNADSGRFEIDQNMVEDHITELQRQLKGNSSRDCVFAWIQVWNSYCNQFFTTNFGKPANCFGRQHVDNMLATHQRIQSQVFSSGTAGSGQNLIDQLKQVISQRHGIKDLPDGYFFFPTDLGGLEISSPFISLLQIRDAVVGDFDKLFHDLEKAEKEAYRRAKDAFETTRVTAKHHRGRTDPDFEPEDKDTFFSFEEFTRYRDAAPIASNYTLVDIFNKLLEEPQQQSLVGPDGGEVESAIRGLPHESTRLRGWFMMEPYWRWITQLYGPEIIAKFGGLKIVDAGLLPMGMVGLFRSGRVQWQE